MPFHQLFFVFLFLFFFCVHGHDVNLLSARALHRNLYKSHLFFACRVDDINAESEVLPKKPGVASGLQDPRLLDPDIFFEILRKGWGANPDMRRSKCPEICHLNKLQLWYCLLRYLMMSPC